MAERTEHLRADAVRYGADAAEVDRAIAALRAPEHRVTSAVVDLGGRTVSVSHPGRGGEDAVFVPGHGALVDAAFVRRQRDWLRTQM